MTTPPRELILVLDRSPEVRDLLCELLAIEGYRVIAPASLPEDAQVVAQLRPGLIILDYFLGTPSPGWRLLTQLRTNPVTRPIPVLVCTAARSAVRAWEGDLATLGGRIVGKPFDLDELLGAVRHALGSRQADHADEAVPGMPSISRLKLSQEWDESGGGNYVW